VKPAWFGADSRDRMASVAPHELLRSARARRGDDLAALSSRTGLRVHHIRAIEEGRLGDLPPGIYGRAAIRSFATAYGLDAEAVLADCDTLLPRVEDPIDAIARVRGIATASDRGANATPVPPGAAEIRLRPIAAATLDGAVMSGVLAAAIAGAALISRVSIAALDSSPVPLCLVALILGTAYYAWLGGLSGATFGEYAVGPQRLRRDPRPLTLRAIALRTLAAATADARAFYAFGMWASRYLTRGAARSVPPPALSPSQPPPLDREEALTWSMNQRASVPPPPLRPRHG